MNGLLVLVGLVQLAVAGWMFAAMRSKGQGISRRSMMTLGGINLAMFVLLVVVIAADTW